MAKALASSPPVTEHGRFRPRMAARSDRSSPLASPWMRRSTNPCCSSKQRGVGSRSSMTFVRRVPGSIRAHLRTSKNRYHKAKSGHYYRLMIEHVKKVLADPKRVCPEYDAAQGFEVAGFVWLQGWNDMVDYDVYPEVPTNSKKPRIRQIQRVPGGLHPRCAQGSQRAEDAFRHRRDGS